MAELSYFWDGSTVGDAGPYDDADMATYFRALLGSSGNEGVLFGWLNDLEVTDGGGLNADVDTGAASIYGTWFENDAVATVALVANNAQTVIVRVSWAAQTARLATTTAALVQTPGVTYEIPLATLTTDGASITVGPVDARDYCEFSTVAQDLSVFRDNIQDEAVTWAKQVDQTRGLFLGAGSFEPDIANPATWANDAPGALGGQGYGHVYLQDRWKFVDGATNSIWVAFQMPSDLTGTGPPHDVELLLWLSWLRNPATGGYGSQRWTWNLYNGASGAALGNQSGTYIWSMPAYFSTIWRWTFRESIATFTATAGDIVLLQISRTGGHAGDSNDGTGYLFGVELNYTADG